MGRRCRHDDAAHEVGAQLATPHDEDKISAAARAANRVGIMARADQKAMQSMPHKRESRAPRGGDDVIFGFPWNCRGQTGTHKHLRHAGSSPVQYMEMMVMMPCRRALEHGPSGSTIRSPGVSRRAATCRRESRMPLRKATAKKRCCRRTPRSDEHGQREEHEWLPRGAGHTTDREAPGWCTREHDGGRRSVMVRWQVPAERGRNRLWACHQKPD